MTPAPRRRKGRAEEPVVFRGPPDRLSSLLTEPSPAAAEGRPPSASLGGVDVRAVRIRRLEQRGADATRATLRLAASTAPGTYEGSVDVEGREVPIIAEVQARPRLVAEPHRLVLEAEPGGSATVEVELVNTGNVACDVSGATTFCLFDGGGLEHAVWAALANDPPKGKERIDVLLDDLAESHGGLVTTKVERGTTIGVGESARVRLTLRFSDRLRPGRRYAGSWRGDGLRVPIRITTAPAPARARAKGAR